MTSDVESAQETGSKYLDRYNDKIYAIIIQYVKQYESIIKLLLNANANANLYITGRAEYMVQ